MALLLSTISILRFILSDTHFYLSYEKINYCIYCPITYLRLRIA